MLRKLVTMRDALDDPAYFGEVLQRRSLASGERSGSGARRRADGRRADYSQPSRAASASHWSPLASSGPSLDGEAARPAPWASWRPTSPACVDHRECSALASAACCRSSLRAHCKPLRPSTSSPAFSRLAESVRASSKSSTSDTLRWRRALTSVGPRASGRSVASPPLPRLPMKSHSGAAMTAQTRYARY